MVKKAFFAFEQLNKPARNKKSCGGEPSETKKPAGASLPKIKIKNQKLKPEN